MLDAIEQLFGRVWPVPAKPSTPALVLSGGGARASYQAGVIQYLADLFPDVEFPILTGVSAGAINAAHLASHTGTFREAAAHLSGNWNEITAEHIFEEESTFSFLRRMLRRSEIHKGHPEDSVFRVEEGQGLLRTEPLRAYLEEKLKTVNGELVGVAQNIQAGWLRAFCVTATNYVTGQTMTWVQGADIEHWQRPDRVGVRTALSVDHIMASTALPLIFPAISVGNAWFGDGGIRLTAPLSPAIHLGADRIMVISTRYKRSRREADEPSVVGYPPAAQVMGLLMNAIFLDVLDQDAITLQRINELVDQLPRRKRMGLRPIKLLMVRPSQDLGKLASDYELHLQGLLRLVTRGLGSEDTKSPDWLSMLLFDSDYVARLMQIGWEDARKQHDQIAAFIEDEMLESMDGLEAGV